VVATTRLFESSKKNLSESGITDQADLTMGRMVSKKFKIAAFYEFLETRRWIWNLQIFTVLFVMIGGYPTAILS
jgi:hypothetical protein